jgi:hypothetical protein
MPYTTAITSPVSRLRFEFDYRRVKTNIYLPDGGMIASYSFDTALLPEENYVIALEALAEDLSEYRGRWVFSHGGDALSSLDTSVEDAIAIRYA